MDPCVLTDASFENPVYHDVRVKEHSQQNKYSGYNEMKTSKFFLIFQTDENPYRVRIDYFCMNSLLQADGSFHVETFINDFNAASKVASNAPETQC